jgi:hypothetical protein
MKKNILMSVAIVLLCCTSGLPAMQSVENKQHSKPTSFFCQQRLCCAIAPAFWPIISERSQKIVTLKQAALRIKEVLLRGRLFNTGIDRLYDELVNIEEQANGLCFNPVETRKQYCLNQLYGGNTRKHDSGCIYQIDALNELREVIADAYSTISSFRRNSIKL